jgi:NAD+ synthase (glutamine-hydrolysing)
MREWNLPLLREFLDAQPSAELIPSTGGVEQSDEVEMQMTYAELAMFGKLRKVEKCVAPTCSPCLDLLADVSCRLGPFSMYIRLLGLWTERSPRDIAEKVKLFHRFYCK